MSDYNDDFYEDDYLWDVEHGYIDEPSSAPVGDFVGLRSILGGLLLLSVIFTIFNIDSADIPGALLVILGLGASWIWAKIRGFI